MPADARRQEGRRRATLAAVKRELRTAAPRRPSFFIPGIAAGRPEEDEYARLRTHARSATELAPRPKRIFSLELRMGGRDRVVEVGRAFPDGGGNVLAIFDVGGDRPYAVYTDEAESPRRLGRHVYTVLEFA